MLLDTEYIAVHALDEHPEAFAGVRFQRALRLPPDTPPYNSVRSDAFHLPRPLNDHYEDLSFDWLLRSNHSLICANASESVTLEFATPHGYPFAVMIAIGGTDALTGEPVSSGLSRTPQNYIPLSCQNWLDSWQDAAGTTHQFLPPPPGPPGSDGVPPPADDSSDCIDVTFIPMKSDAFQRYAQELDANAGRAVYGTEEFPLRFQETHMLNGRMTYEREMGENWDAGMVYPDPFQIEDWNMTEAQTVSVTMVGPDVWKRLTGEDADGPVFERRIYDEAGVPWDDAYAEDG